MIKQFVPAGICLECQGCCRFGQEDTVWSPRLLQGEIEELLKENILLSEDKRIGLVACPAQGNYLCVFLNPQDNKCRIYLRRPFECQLYPFLINRLGKVVFLAVDLKCPFAKEKVESGEFIEYVNYLIKFCNTAVIRKILKDNPQIIQSYCEVLNLAELKI